MAETGKRDDPYQQFNFLVEIDGIARAGFMECTGTTTDTDTIDYREGNDISMNVRKLSGLRKYTNIVLKRGYTQDKSLWDWRKKIINGAVERRSADIILLNENREEVLRWRVREAWISKWDSGPFNAKTNDVVMETVELVHEGLELV
ncbi:phage tail protein [Floridanema evergladense]|uniref:Phage tail protein n=1 Tax=Floridaenema evergladense BLCC-F167 TaxID=3153639 RepID=A0ABV4WJS9_9CYAN